MKTLGQFISESKATYCGRCGTTHVPPSKGGTCPALKEDVNLDEARAVNHQKKIESLEKKIKDHRDRLSLARERRKMRANYHKSAQGDAEMRISSKISELERQLWAHQQALKEGYNHKNVTVHAYVSESVDAEQIDELSTEKLLAYKKKAREFTAKVPNPSGNTDRKLIRKAIRRDVWADEADERVRKNTGSYNPSLAQRLKAKLRKEEVEQDECPKCERELESDRYCSHCDHYVDKHGNISEDNEQINELSIDTKKRYINKAIKDHQTRSAMDMMGSTGKRDPKYARDNALKKANRDRYIRKAYYSIPADRRNDGSLKEEVEDAGTRHELRKTKIMHNGEHVATIHTYRGRGGNWTSGVYTPDGKSARDKYGVDLMDTKRTMISKVKKYHKGQ